MGWEVACVCACMGVCVCRGGVGVHVWVRDGVGWAVVCECVCVHVCICGVCVRVRACAHVCV